MLLPHSVSSPHKGRALRLQSYWHTWSTHLSFDRQSPSPSHRDPIVALAGIWHSFPTQMVQSVGGSGFVVQSSFVWQDVPATGLAE